MVISIGVPEQLCFGCLHDQLWRSRCLPHPIAREVELWRCERSCFPLLGCFPFFGLHTLHTEYMMEEIRFSRTCLKQ